MTSQASPLHVTRRRFLALCAATATAVALPSVIRLRAARAFVASSFVFSSHQRAVLKAAANAVIPSGQVLTRRGTLLTVPGAGDSGAVDFVQNLLDGSLIYAAGAKRPPYVKLPAGVTATVFPAAGQVPLWTAKRIGWFGDVPRATRPYAWPSELERLQALYVNGVATLDTAAGGDFSAAAVALREPILRAQQRSEVNAYNGKGEDGQPFFLTFLDHVAQACFGDPIYGGNQGYVYWDLIDFTGPSYINAGGPAPGQGWSAKDMTAGFDRTKTVTQ
ncbi:MAG: gluconate 2-dehydrogenase subunit 3 family protein [Candidatus Dormibacteraeota bacterium]|nr:gluconate 2-dehydrogenase subunit 3 family protein [Candidatus Dormibacteraeota bacterium]